MCEFDQVRFLRILKFIHSLNTLACDELSILIHIYPNKPRREIEVTVYNYQAESSFTCGLMSNLVIGSIEKEYSPA